MIGHDIGLMVGYADAAEYRLEVSHLVVTDALPPGTAVFDRLHADPRVWHFAFRGVREVAGNVSDFRVPRTGHRIAEETRTR